MNQNKISKAIKVILTVAVLAIGTSYALAVDWSPPPGPPPGCPNGTPGCEVPLNVSLVNQIKQGGLGIAGFFSAKEKAVIGHGTQAPSIADALKLRVFGKVGADAYCDQNGNNCIVPPGGSSTSTGLWQQINDRIENTNPGRVDILGKIKIIGGEPERNKVLASNKEGVGNWKTLAELGVGGDFKGGCDPGYVIQSIDTTKTPPVTCVKLSNGSTGGGFFNWNFSFLGGNGGDGGGACYSTSCSIDNRELSCRPGYAQSQVSNCGTTEFVQGLGNVPTKHALCCPR